MKCIVVLSNHHAWTYNLRSEILEALVNDGNRVIVVVGYGNRIDDIKALGCEFIDIPIDRHGINPIKELNLIKKYHSVLKSIKPDIVLSYTIKPNLYGGYLCQRMKIPFVPNITGLGTAVEKPGLLQKILLKTYKFVFKDVYRVLFQNTANRDLFLKNKIVKNNFDMLPGSGVNIDKFSLLTFPKDEYTNFVFISRIMKEKGIEQYLYAAKTLKKKYPNTTFHICGFCEQSYENIIKKYVEQGIVIYHGMVDDVRKILIKCHCTVLPTYYPEGLSNVLLESASSGRALITTDRPGCKEVIRDGINGYIVKAKDNDDLLWKMEKFINLPFEDKKNMGLSGRRLIEQSYNRQIIVDKYIDIIHNIK